jgi:hypothetical protein
MLAIGNGEVRLLIGLIVLGLRWCLEEVDLCWGLRLGVVCDV